MAAAVLAVLSTVISGFIPYQKVGVGVLALIFGMLLNPFIAKYSFLNEGLSFTSKKILRIAIILMGINLSFSQVFRVGQISLVVMTFTLLTAFGGGFLVGRLFKLNWKLSSLISTGTGICGGSAIAAVAPTIDADESDIAYAISVTFIFDVLMVILFPIMGVYFGITDLGYGLWAGTAINDTSSVVAAGYAFSDVAGNFAVIVKLTRTLSIIPVVLVFSYIYQRKNASSEANINKSPNKKVSVKKFFPWFILLFLGVVAIKGTGFIPDTLSNLVSNMSKFLMVMSLGAIGLKTNFVKLSKLGLSPLFHGFIISTLVVIVSFFVQIVLGHV